MRNRSASKTVPGLLLLSFATLVLAQPAAALNADYWRGGWRTPLGDEPHIYEFVIRGNRVTGVYCRNCSDATTIGFIDGTWDEKAGIDFTVTFANPDGSITICRRPACHARRWAADRDGGRGHTERERADARQGPARGRPRWGAGVSPPAGHSARAARDASRRRWRWRRRWRRTARALLAGRTVQGVTAGGRRRHVDRPRSALGMNRQIFTFLLVGDRLRGVVCGRCDNPYTIGAMENIFIVGDTLYFDIVHQDWGEIDPPTFDRNIVAQVVQNEMIAAILGKDLVIDPANPPARPAGRGFTLVGPIAPEGTRGNSSEGVDVWGPGTGSAIQPPPGRTPIRPVNPGR